MAITVAAHGLPGNLAQFNYIDFTLGRSFTHSLRELADALNTDVKWLREHTRLAELARRWQQHGQPPTLLLRGPELDAAESWLAAPQKTLSATAEHRDFIQSSLKHQGEELEAERYRLSQVALEQSAKQDALTKLSRRTAMGLAASGALTLTAGELAYWGISAEARFQEERIRSEEAQRNSTLAAIEKEASRPDLEASWLLTRQRRVKRPQMGQAPTLRLRKRR